VALAGAIFAGLGGASAGRPLAATPAGAVAPEDITALQQAFLTGFKGALMVCAAVAAAGLLATLIRGDEQQPAGGAVGPAGARHEPTTVTEAPRGYRPDSPREDGQAFLGRHVSDKRYLGRRAEDQRRSRGRNA